MLFHNITNIVNEDVVLMPCFKLFEEPVKKGKKPLILQKQQQLPCSILHFN